MAEKCVRAGVCIVDQRKDNTNFTRIYIFKN